MYSGRAVWARRIDGYNVPVILPAGKLGDGARTGFDLPVNKARNVSVMVSAWSALGKALRTVFIAQ